MKKILFSILTISVLSLPVLATNPVQTAMPSLSIAPDGRAAGMGDLGVATSPDLNSQHWNPAKYAFMESKGGITANYTPWLTKLVNDIDLAYLAGYFNMGEMAGTISGSFTYFSMGTVALVDGFGGTFAEATPNEWAIDLAYSRKLHEYVSMAVALRFLYSDLNNGVNSSVSGSAQEMYPAWTMAADVSLYYRQPISLPMGESYLGVGLNISNLGGKMTHDEGLTQNFIPANFRLGVSYELPFDDHNTLMASVECSKLLVPTYKSKFAINEETGDALTGQALQDWYSSISSPKGWWMSFCDAPGYYNELTGKNVSPLMEEFQEVQWGVGLEYSYNKMFFARAGYSHENYWKGNRRYVTLGAGFNYSIFNIDFAYCLAVTPSNPLDQTMRFTLGFDLAGIKDLVNNRK